MSVTMELSYVQICDFSVLDNCGRSQEKKRNYFQDLPTILVGLGSDTHDCGGIILSK